MMLQLVCLHLQLTKEESLLNFEASSALELHNRVRAFAGWPGTSAMFSLEDEAAGKSQ